MEQRPAICSSLIYAVQREEWERLYDDPWESQTHYTKFVVSATTFELCFNEVSHPAEIDTYWGNDGFYHIDLNVTQEQFPLIAHLLEKANA